MWLIVFALAALAATAAWALGVGHKIEYLAMALWAVTAATLVDHTMGWVADGAEGEYLEMGVEPLILSLAMLAFVVAAWALYLVWSRAKPRASRGGI